MEFLNQELLLVSYHLCEVGSSVASGLPERAELRNCADRVCDALDPLAEHMMQHHHLLYSRCTHTSM